MILTARGERVVVSFIIALSMVFVFASFTIGQNMKEERCAQTSQC